MTDTPGAPPLCPSFPQLIGVQVPFIFKEAIDALSAGGAPLPLWRAPLPRPACLRSLPADRKSVV